MRASASLSVSIAQSQPARCALCSRIVSSGVCIRPSSSMYSMMRAPAARSAGSWTSANPHCSSSWSTRLAPRDGALAIASILASRSPVLRAARRESPSEFHCSPYWRSMRRSRSNSSAPPPCGASSRCCSRRGSPSSDEPGMTISRATFFSTSCSRRSWSSIEFSCRISADWMSFGDRPMVWPSFMPCDVSKRIPAIGGHSSRRGSSARSGWCRCYRPPEGEKAADARQFSSLRAIFGGSGTAIEAPNRSRHRRMPMPTRARSAAPTPRQPGCSQDHEGDDPGSRNELDMEVLHPLGRHHHGADRDFEHQPEI